MGTKVRTIEESANRKRVCRMVVGDATRQVPRKGVVLSRNLQLKESNGRGGNGKD